METINSSCIKEKEIAYRESILEKARKGIKISSEERLWLLTHSLYNRHYGIDYFNFAVESIEANQWFLIKIKVESILYDKRILPIISVPAAKGKIITDCRLYNDKGEEKTGKPVKMLALEMNQYVGEKTVKFFSELGLVGVEYQCDYFDSTVKLNKREASFTGNPDFAMKRQIIDDHTIRYYCKDPNSQSFDALVFSLQWEPLGTP